jgi:hypothetical protein
MNKENDIKFYITNSDGNREEFNIGPEGSLGVLALGAVGIKAWKKAKAKAKKEKKEKEKVTDSRKEKE